MIQTEAICINICHRPANKTCFVLLWKKGGGGSAQRACKQGSSFSVHHLKVKLDKMNFKEKPSHDVALKSSPR